MPRKPKVEANHAPPRYDRLKGGTKKAIQLLVGVEDHGRLWEAAGKQRQPIAHFVLAAALAAAEKILKKSS